MKTLLIILAIFSVEYTFSQTTFPSFLEGTWKMENRDIYEHWDQLNPHSLKGFSYEISEGKRNITEYLDIAEDKGKINYTATVIGQNSGKGVTFRLIKSDSVFVFSNPSHDFPKKIVYKKRSETEILVTISNEKDKEFSYTLHKYPDNNSTTDYDEKLAKKLGADDYGMKSYFFVILKTGTNTLTDTIDKELISESFKGHMDNIHRLVEEGKLIVAGPFGKNTKNYRGIFILNNISSEEAAKELLLTDPAIKNGLLDYEIFTWYGSAALPEYLPVSGKIQKTKP
ncbi:MAG: hypothetical protein J0G96_06785 [Flavobacteriia bacterium]|nr:hypothetical protein [Flavobacteriia bacterium]OJX39145.1 MAG: hypothetical protein BGO87_03950 [Flavobacteriia bacterium 40-80]